MSNLRTNVILNYINTITSLLFPVITFPYASRILLPDGIGVVNFQLSVINYIVLFTSLGIPLYAVKEIAKFRDDIELRNKTTIEIIVLSLLLCVLGYIAVFLIGIFGDFHERRRAVRRAFCIGFAAGNLCRAFYKIRRRSGCGKEAG